MKVIIATISVIVIIIGVILMMVAGPHKTQAPATQPSQQTSTLPSAGSVQSGGSGSGNSFAVVGGTNAGNISIATQNGPISARDFLSDTTTTADPYNQGYYDLGGSMTSGVGSSSPAFAITYISSTQYFNIALLREPIATARADAEQFLLQDLGITKEQACALKYMVSVPYWVNQKFTGRNLGFSFCPGAVILPQ